MVIPTLIFLVINLIIFIYVRSSTRRVRPPLSVTENQPSNGSARKFSRRDLHLLRHMLVMITIFVGGWAPLYTLLTTQSQFAIDPVLSASFTIWCELALLCDIVDLYLYNHELRNYLKKPRSRMLYAMTQKTVSSQCLCTFLSRRCLLSIFEINVKDKLKSNSDHIVPVYLATSDKNWMIEKGKRPTFSIFRTN